ncbi:MAG: hypothetical protein M0T73_02270 [Deltaproteobacteria bacterium]|nr:hypothetical protein [Deltaproteobacteria bacterium]
MNRQTFTQNRANCWTKSISGIKRPVIAFHRNACKFLNPHIKIDHTVSKEATTRFEAFKDRILFPFEAAVETLTTLAKPDNKTTLGNLNRVSTFYDRLVGPSDLPCFANFR